MSSAPKVKAVNPVSPIVVVFFLLILGVELVLTLGAQGAIGGPEAIGWRLGAMQDYGFNGAIFDEMRARNLWPGEHVLRFVSFMFVHLSLTHMIVAGVMLLALGKFVGEVFAPWAVALVFLGSGVGGAVIWGLLLNDTGYLIGAFPGVYGLIGAFSYVLWLKLGQRGENQWRAFVLIGFLMAIQLVFGILFGARNDWLADLSGFVCGFLLSFVVSPGGWTRLLQQMRRS